MTLASRQQGGLLDLVLERRDAVTHATRALAQPPLQLSRVRYDDVRHPDAAALTLLHLGGILAGDCNRLTVTLGANAQAQISAAAATQVYRMPQGSAAQSITLRLGAHSRLAWLSAPLILFGGANFTQNVRVELAAGAQLVHLDVLVPGRLARGEAFAFSRYEARFEVYDTADRCLVAERALLEPPRHTLAAPGMFADTPVVGSLYLLGEIDVEQCEASVLALDAALGTAALPNGGGLLVRALGHSASAVQARLMQVWRALT